MTYTAWLADIFVGANSLCSFLLASTLYPEFALSFSFASVALFFQ
jgi:hypothetical protein